MKLLISLSKEVPEWWSQLPVNEQEKYVFEHPKTALKPLKRATYVKSNPANDAVKHGTFVDSDEHDEWSEIKYEKWYAQLTEDEAKTLSFYKQDKGYRKINRALRGKDPMDDITKLLVDSMDSAISKARCPNKIEVYRGMIMPRSMHTESGDYRHLVGHTFSDKGFTSVTTLAKVAKDFMPTDKDLEESTVFVRMTLPRGAPAASMNAGLQIKSKTVIRHTEEAELLLPRGMSYTIKKVEHVAPKKRPPATVFHVEPVFPED